MEKYQFYIALISDWRILLGFEYVDGDSLEEDDSELDWSICIGLIFMEIVFRKYR